MNTLINRLIKFKLVEGRSEHIDFEDVLTGKYSRKSADITEEKLRELAEASILNYEREEFGFRIEILNMEELKEIQSALEVVGNADDEMKKLLNDIAIEIKGKSPEEAKEIIRGYREHLGKWRN